MEEYKEALRAYAKELLPVAYTYFAENKLDNHPDWQRDMAGMIFGLAAEMVKAENYFSHQPLQESVHDYFETSDI